MKKCLLFINILVLLTSSPHADAQYSTTVANGVTTAPILLPSCTGGWTNDHPGIGLAATGTISVPSFTPVNTGTTPIVATISVSSNIYAYAQCRTLNTFDIINTITGAVSQSFYSLNGCQALAVTPDQQKVFFQTLTGIVALNTLTGTLALTFPGPNVICNEFVFSADGITLYMSSYTTNQIFVYNVFSGSGTTINLPAGIGSPQSMVLSPDGTKLYFGDNTSGALQVLSTATNTIIAAVPLVAANDICYGVAISPDGTRLYLTDETANVIKVVNTATNALITTIADPGGPTYCIVSGDGSKLYVSNSISGTMSVINTTTYGTIATIPLGNDPFGLTLTPDGTQVYVSVDGSSKVDVISVATNTVVLSLPAGGQPAPWGQFIAAPCGIPYSFTITVNPSPFITPGAVTGTIQACVGSASASPSVQTFSVSGSYLTANIVATAPAGFQVSLTPAGGYGSSVTLTPVSGSESGVPVYVRSAASDPVGSVTGNVVLSTSGGTNVNVAVAGVVTALVTPAVSVVASANGVCAGVGVTFTATPVGGGTAPGYQWVVDGADVGGGGPTFSSSTLNNGDRVSCVLTSNALCATGPATSNTVVMAVTPLVTPAVSIAASANVVCAGVGVTFTATPVGGGPAPGYQWLLNGANVGGGGPTFSSNALNNGDQVSCVLTSNAACATGPATSNTVVMTVTALVTPAVSVVASADAICAGVGVVFTATPVGGGSLPAYRWVVNGGNVGGGGPTFSSSSLNNGDRVSCVLTSNAACATGPATSNAVVMAVTSLVTPAVSVVASANAICGGVGVVFNATPAGGGSLPAYQWVVNGGNVGGGGSTFSSGSLNDGDQVSCVLTSNAACATGPATSNTVAMTVTSLVTPAVSVMASATAICAGAAVTFTATPVGGGSLPAYQWALNGGNIGGGGSTYSSSSLNDGDQVSCVLTSNAACATGPALSNTVAMTVTSLVTPSVSVVASASAICAGVGVTFTATPVGGGSLPAYQWVLNGGNVGGGGPTFNSNSLNDGDQVGCVLTSGAACATGPATSNVVAMAVTPVVTPALSVVASATAICAGVGVVFTATPAGGGSLPAYQWVVDGGNVGSGGSTFSSGNLNDGDQISCVLTSNAVCATGPAISNAVAMTVTSVVTPSVSVAASATEICAGSSVTFTATASNGAAGAVYAWMVNGAASGGNAATYTSNVLQNGDQVACTVTDDLACALPGSSLAVQIAVDPLPTITFPVDPVYIASGGTELNPAVSGTIAQYEWSPAIGLSAIDVAAPVADPVDSQTYQLQVTTDKGCIAVAKVLVVIRMPLALPKAFTPNGDGHNDVFRIPVGAEISLEQFSVFNRWGVLVFSTRNPAVGWDGSYHGQPAAAGTYVYVVNGKDFGGKSVVLTGTVILIR